MSIKLIDGVISKVTTTEEVSEISSTAIELRIKSLTTIVEKMKAEISELEAELKEVEKLEKAK